MGNYASRLKGDATSTDQSSSEGRTNEVKCHYELLAVDPQATPDEIKKAYRRQALLHHPDKNPDRQEEATAYFSQLQKAYEVLSDPQEKAWYDRNRDAILGRARQKKKQTTGNAPTLDDLMQYFNTSVYSGFGDDPKGFFTVYRRLFEVLEEFEQDHLDDLDDDEYDPEEHTSFGFKETPVEPTLYRFYEKWLNFTSTRPFIEIEAYDTEYADNRRMRRAMEKENEKKREALRREFSEAVRSLAGFVRKRDPRWSRYQAEKQAERERAEAARKSAVKASRRADIEGFVEPDWARKDLDDLQSAAKEFFQLHHEDHQPQSDDEDELSDLDDDPTYDDDYDEIYCDPCKKSFKNKLQWKNHEQSKKHKQALWKMGISTIPRYEDEENVPSERQESDEREDSDDQEESDEQEDFDGHSVDEDLADNFEEPDSARMPELGSEEALEDLLARIRLEESGRATKQQQQQPSAKLKKEKKAKKPNQPGDNEDMHRCTVCREAFQSRNQLFKHVNELGHAQAPKGGKQPVKSSKKR